ncbi:High-affinity glucose transporter HXT2 [Talaromyces islandicus]|uniref:High-affinity glucose transporter HXT2 n=1 Tax=Talaromyces islandicus TaxID=28573 RepID=A0A0U1MBN1_TALIS|nr:High-affinity glucose transporter HXT2 [Talaromyces islandicus]
MENRNSAWSRVTPLLLFSCFCLLVGDVLFGYDTGSFSGILANTGFINQFGSYNPQTQSYSIDSLHTSLLSSLPFIGKFIGCLLAGPLIEKYGHRAVFFGLSLISVIGVIVEITAAGTGIGSGRYAQFVVGRIIVYASVGLVEVDVTTYQSEIVPASFRGLVVVSLQLFLTVGTIIATGINKGFSTSTTSVGWKTVTGVQLVFPILIVFFTFFIPNSPRWLLSKDHAEEAVDSLRRLRPHADAVNGKCDAEIQSIREKLQEIIHKAPWIDLVRGNNLRRTLIVMVYYFFQQVSTIHTPDIPDKGRNTLSHTLQTTGQAFVSTYATTFYKTNGYAAEAFTYPVIGSCLGLLSVLPAMYFIDKYGRRYTLMASFSLQALWLFLLAGLGERNNGSTVTKNSIVAAFILYSFFYNMGGASIPYLLGAEIPTFAVREKTQALGASWNVVWAFVTNFVIPYMIDTIHFKVGWVFGSISLLALLFTIFFLPETKGRTLEEIDAIFSVPYNPFRRTARNGTDSPGKIADEKVIERTESQ